MLRLIKAIIFKAVNSRNVHTRHIEALGFRITCTTYFYVVLCIIYCFTAKSEILSYEHIY